LFMIASSTGALRGKSSDAELQEEFFERQGVESTYED